MKNLISHSVTVLFTVAAALPAVADLSIVTEPEPQVTQELRGNWRVVTFYNDDSGRVEPIYEDGSNIWISYDEEGFKIDGLCSPVSSDIYASDGFYEILGDTASNMPFCQGLNEGPIRLFSIAFPVDGYYHVINNRLHLFNVDGDHRMTLSRIPQVTR
ncbi:hypothetical protein [Nioella sp.]|uniref:hypothetical protein n=1 Tax=Nioella sp. TaxID=1912091 RepID=UPI003A835A44